MDNFQRVDIFNENPYTQLTSSKANKSLRIHSTGRERTFRRLFGLLRSAKNNTAFNNRDQPQLKTGKKLTDLPTFHSIKHFTCLDKDVPNYQKNQDKLVFNLNAHAIAQTGSIHAEAEIFNHIFNNTYDSIRECSNDLNTRICFQNIPNDTGITSIISQIVGGPLKRIRVIHNNDKRGTLKEVQIEFKNRMGAEAFMRYGCRSHFKINGVHLEPQWSLYHYSEKSIPNFKLYNGEEVSRSLVLKKYSDKLKKSSHCKELNIPLYPLNVCDIINDFSKFGKIISVVPVVSRKLCISIFYMDIQSSINAIEAYHKEGSPLFLKYSKVWLVWFGKDVSDTPSLEF
ncbi:Ssp2p PWA37_001622 [Arxiozyma heterogenica]|uniref:RRM domain-containing protein n=1 Tax=Arxiozyma heterogenica TaxID=278026 RepID=A0AAN7W2Q8_9SACH|nr:hypothetical protein RI543_002544 [Kazachstania heterogenica]